jgi:4-amino-4-deoxy-L-arabinose transferase-like glycosyltransferase
MRKINLVIIFILFFATIYRLFFGLGNQPIERWDERTNIDVVTDSIAQKDFPVLYLGQKPFFEKPPLWYMVNAVIAGTVGATPVSMRITSALSGLLIILLSAFAAWRWWGFIAGMVTWIVLLCSNQLFVTNSGGYFATHTFRSADLDTLQILFILVAFVAAVEIKRNRFLPIVLGIASGLAILTKGPMGLLPMVLLTGMEIFKKKNQRREIFIAWLIMILVVLPWYIFMSIRFGSDFLEANLGYHMAERMIVPLEGHQGSNWIYLEILASWRMFLFSFLLIPGFIWVIIRKKYLDKRVLFLVLMVIFCFIIPSVVQTKLAWYILPIYPFAAMMIGAFSGGIAREEIEQRHNLLAGGFVMY